MQATSNQARSFKNSTTVSISKESWLYKIAYWFEKPVKRVSVCRLFWRCVLFLPFFYLFVLPFAVCFSIFLSITVFIVAPLFGYRSLVTPFCFLKTMKMGQEGNRPDTLKENDFLEIAPGVWPKIGGCRIWPISIFVLGGLTYELLPFFAGIVSWISTGAVNLSNCGATTNIAATLVVLALTILFFRSGFFRFVVRPYLGAKHRKFCPYVDFTD